MSNTNDANLIIATVLSELYQVFPVRIDLESSNGNTKYHETIRWLEHEGFLRVRDDWGGFFRGVVLTPKGFQILNSVGIPHGNDETIGQRLAFWLKGGSTEQIRIIVNQFISDAIPDNIRE
jgi:hypothetical protein